MNWIKDLKIQLSRNETPPRVNEAPIPDQDNSIHEEGTMILDPIVTRGKGRPPSKMKASKVDQIVKKKLARKKTQEESQKIKIVQLKKKGPCTSSVQDGQNYFLSGNGIINHLAPFNPNQNHIGQINQVPYYAQIINHKVGYYELLQAQHHINNHPSLRHDQPSSSRHGA
ncbi:hypothetical protein OROGR_028945 [Orobanche gracilis]